MSPKGSAAANEVNIIEDSISAALSPRIKTDPNVPKSHMKPMRPLRGRFTHARVTDLLTGIYGADKFQEMKAAGVDKRMMFGTNPHYQALAIGNELKDIDGNVLVPKMPPSLPIAALILPRLEETFSLEGAKDPSNQMNFTPQEDHVHGKLLHKYDEIVLGYVSPVCSAHCRYCYRLDLFNKDTGKQNVRPEELRDYITAYNAKLEKEGGFDPKTGEKRYPIRELLLSGGDVMVLPNAFLYRFLVAAGQAGIHTLRIGSKEWAFRPERFDEALAETLRLVHEQFPHMHINMVSHLTHPDEFLLRDENGAYIPNENGGGYQWLDVSRQAVQRMLSLPFVSIENQTPMISRVNDDEKSMRILHEELRRLGVKPKYIFQGRDIEGHKAFSVPVETAWRIHTNAMKGISDTGRSRFAMSTEWGKMEIISVTDGIELPEEVGDIFSARVIKALNDILGDGLIIFRSHRSPHDAKMQGDVIIAKRNPEALWISGYEDRIIYDSRVPQGEGKYAGLISILTQSLGANIFEKFIADNESSSLLLGAANDQDTLQKAVASLAN